MSPPHVPGIPGTRLPAEWEKPLADAVKRIERLEKMVDPMREKLDSINEFDEDSIVTIPTDAPPRAKVLLGFASGLTPNGRLIIGLAIIAALTLLFLRGVLKVI